MKYYTLLLLLIISSCSQESAGGNRKKIIVFSPISAKEKTFESTIDSLVQPARDFVKQNHYNEETVFIADLSVHSGLPRFAVVSLKDKKILHKGMVAHGCGSSWYATEAAYSNMPNSSCSSLGKYKVGEQYNGRFGKAYKLYGLDKTNSNAYKRFVVLHAYDCVPDDASYPLYLCNSRGCPMVSYKFLKTLAGYIKDSNKPVLLWIVGS